MITTNHLQAHIFTLENLNELKAVILIVGSCRCVAFLNYLDRYNKSEGLPFRIHFIEPFTFTEQQRNELETDEKLLSVLRNTGIFIHEHYGNYGMFNTSKDAEKNIYQFGINPRLDISVPNFHDHMILERDYEAYGVPLPPNYAELGEAAVKKFCDLCALTSFSEMAAYFRDNWRTKRFFWRPNHTSAEFTLFIFRLMNEKFLHLPLTEQFWQEASKEDLFKEPHTHTTENDVRNYNLTWHD